MEPCVSCIFISPIVWTMCENLHYQSVYFKELHNQQEYYWPTIYRTEAAVVSTITSYFYYCYRPDRLSCLWAFPYDHFKIYMIAPIVWVELNSIQTNGVVSVVRLVLCNRLSSFPCDGFDHLNIALFETTGTIRTIWAIIGKPGLN